MLNRRYLRIKVFQQLYSFFISPGADKNRTELELFKSLEKIYDLYLSLLFLLIELNNQAKEHFEKSKTKFISSPDEIIYKTRFIDNRVIKCLSVNTRFKQYLENKNITWHNENDLPAKIFKTIRQSPEYAEYMNSAEDNFEKDRKFLARVYKKYIFNSEALHYHFEEKNIHWEEDITLANISTVKTLENIPELAGEEDSLLLPLYKDEAEDSEFARKLFRATIKNDEEFKNMISAKAANWELERIAVADMILMKMALCELLEFENIPVKVTLNEYIEVSKDYSTPQSKTFINGILDKLVADLKAGGRIIKKGRGLVE